MEKNYVVLAKQVPDTKKITGKAMKDDGTVNRAALPAIFNPDDLCALEMALRLKDQYGGTVTVVTMGPPSATEILRQSLYRGADRCILLTDRKFAGSDTLATSMVLSYALKKIKNISIILCGRQAIDGDTAQVGPQITEKLGVAQISYVQEILNIKKNTVKIKRIIENGYAVQEAPMPILMTCCSTSDAYARPCSAKNIQRYKKVASYSETVQKYMADGTPKEEAFKAAKNYIESLPKERSPIEEWDISTIELDEALCGLGGSPTWVKQIESVVLTAVDHKHIPATNEGISSLVLELIDDHILD